MFIHKVDGLSDDYKIETQRDIHQKANDELADIGFDSINLKCVFLLCFPVLLLIALLYCIVLYLAESIKLQVVDTSIKSSHFQIMLRIVLTGKYQCTYFLGGPIAILFM